MKPMKPLSHRFGTSDFVFGRLLKLTLELFVKKHVYEEPTGQWHLDTNGALKPIALKILKEFQKMFEAS